MVSSTLSSGTKNSPFRNEAEQIPEAGGARGTRTAFHAAARRSRSLVQRPGAAYLGSLAAGNRATPTRPSTQLMMIMTIIMLNGVTRKMSATTGTVAEFTTAR